MNGLEIPLIDTNQNKQVTHNAVSITGKKAKELVYSGVHDWNHV